MNWSASIYVKLGKNSEALMWFENAFIMAKAQCDPATEKTIHKTIDDCHRRIAQGVNAVHRETGKQPFSGSMKRQGHQNNKVMYCIKVL